MKFIKTILWDFNFLLKKGYLLSQSLVSVFLLLIITIALYGFGHSTSAPVTNYELAPYYGLLLIIVLGVFYNRDSWDFHFFMSVINCIVYSVFRIGILLLLLLLISTGVKFLGIVIFQVTPYKSDKWFALVSRFIFYYPLMQVPLFFYQYKNKISL